MRKTNSIALAALVALALPLAALAAEPAEKPAAVPAGPGKIAKPTAEEAQRFVEAAEKRLLEVWTMGQTADWVYGSYITDDTERIAAEMQKQTISVGTELALAATRFDGLELPYDVARKLKLLKLSVLPPAPSDPRLSAELAQAIVSMQSDYGRGKYCPVDKGIGTPGKKHDEKAAEKSADCLDVTAIGNVMKDSRDPKRLQEVWLGWHDISPPMRNRYARYVELSNQGARELGFADTGAMWRSKYDMPPDDFAQELDRLWEQVKPLYLQLHAHVRAKLTEKYGESVVPREGPIPAHLLGNIWAQSWENLYEELKPPSKGMLEGANVTPLLEKKKVDELEMVRYGDRFFQSLGFAPMPKTFWERSMFTKPAGREVVCHASAWDIDQVEDLRIKMCIQVNDEDFRTIHHELGHNIYQRAYNRQPLLYRDSANDGFHEAIGDTISLSITPQYLNQVGLLAAVPKSSPQDDLGLLMTRALEKVAFLPFGLLVDRWRWKVFSGEVAPANYNAAWWELREKYQGVAPPMARSEANFDPGAKYHVSANVPYSRYFLSHILQFQFYRSMCADAGHTGPLHTCSFYGNKEVGAKLQKMLEMGMSKPWPDALEALTGQRQMDATAMVDYFKPLMEWLKAENTKNNRKIGW